MYREIIEQLKVEGAFLTTAEGLPFNDAPFVGTSVYLRFRPQVSPRDITDSVADTELNLHSFMGAAEMSGRELYRKYGGPDISAALSNAVNQGFIMGQIDNMHWNSAETGIENVKKLGGKPWEIIFTNDVIAGLFVKFLRGH